MSKFWIFLKLLWHRATSRVFWFWDILGAVAPFNPLLPVRIPELDWRASAVIYSVVLLSSMYLVWRDERIEVEKRDATIARLKDAVPRYEITHGVVRRATVANLIGKYETEVSNLEAAVAAANAAPAANTLGGGMLAAMQQLTAAHHTIMRVTGVESREEKLDRLRNYLAELKEYEHALERTYRVDLFITASRSDNNVQIYIESEKPAIFIEDDDFIEDFMPRQFAPSIYEVGITRRGGHPLEYMPNIRKPRTPDQRGEMDETSAHLKFINAGNEESVFTDSLYIQSEEPVIKLKIKIHSSNRREAQRLTVEIPVSNPTIIEVAKT